MTKQTLQQQFPNWHGWPALPPIAGADEQRLDGKPVPHTHDGGPIVGPLPDKTTGDSQQVITGPDGQKAILTFGPNGEPVLTPLQFPSGPSITQQVDDLAVAILRGLSWDVGGLLGMVWAA